MKRTSRLIAAIVMLLMTFPCFVFPASASQQVTATIDGFNVYRDSGYLVVFTHDYGETTGTNEWGYEVVVENNVAVSFNIGNSSIPENGFVVSGHDEDEGGKKMGTWIKENIHVGDYVYYSPNGVLTVSDEPVSTDVFFEMSTNFASTNGIRYENTIVVYTASGKNTGTNDWGYEIVVENGTVVSLGGNNNLVPDGADGFVVSGHGTQVTWLQENVLLGMSASYDDKSRTLTFSYDEKAAIRGMELKVDSLWSTYDEALARYDYFNYASAKAAIEELENTLSTAKKDFEKSGDNSALSKVVQQFDTMANDVALLISESKTVEYRAVWIRPNEYSAEEVDAYVQKLYERGINTVCVETLLNSVMIMPMPENSLFVHDPELNGFDLLQAYIDACHKRKMELHVWLPVFYVGDAGSANIVYSVGTKKPEWRSKSSNGRIDENQGYVMLDPSNMEVQDFLLSTYRYILENYEIDSLQLDYIRYFERTPDYDMGYNEGAMKAFEEKYGERPRYDLSWHLWNEWVQFRCDYVSTFVLRVRKLIDEVAPDVLLGADVVPDPTDSVSKNYQDYFKWLDNGWLDIVYPMAYGNGYESDIIAQVNRCGDKSYIAVGLGIFMDELGPSDMQRQASFNSSHYADGSAYFSALQYLRKKTGEHLIKGVYSSDALAPAFDIQASAKAQLEFAKGRLNDILVPLGAISEGDAASVVSLIDELTSSCVERNYDKAKYDAVVTKLDSVEINDTAKKRVLNDLAIAVKGYSILNKSVDTSAAPETPDSPTNTPDESDKQEESESSSPEESKNDKTDSENEENGIDTVLLIVIIAGALILAACAAVIILTLKKK